jgi:hypothetical protein
MLVSDSDDAAGLRIASRATWKQGGTDGLAFAPLVLLMWRR